MSLNLIPAPVSVETRGGDRPVAEASLVVTEGIPAEGYVLDIGEHSIVIQASDLAGHFYGGLTLRQLEQGGRLPLVHIVDHPRFAYRGAMLDVARHFFPVEAVKRYIDDIALLKLNHLHLHLTDDQGWRIQLDSWPRLTEAGATTQVGGGGGGFYTKDDYREIVEHAAGAAGAAGCPAGAAGSPEGVPAGAPSPCGCSCGVTG